MSPRTGRKDAQGCNSYLEPCRRTTGGGAAERVFITVSRQPGAGAISFSHRLAERLNQDGQGDWSAWDRELVKKVSAEHGIAEEIIEMIPNRHHNWLDDVLQGFAASPNPPDVVEIRAYMQVATVIRASGGGTRDYCRPGRNFYY